MKLGESPLFIEQINRQDPQAYRALYDLYYRALVFYAMRLVTRQDVAEDLVQELFVSMWNKRVTFISGVSFRSYLYNAVYNASLNYLKHKEVEQRYAETVWEQCNEEARVWAERYEEEVYRQLYQAIDRLPPKCREIFLMHMDGKRNDEIAEVLNIAVETVKTQKKRALKFLKQHTPEALALLYVLNPRIFS